MDAEGPLSLKAVGARLDSEVWFVGFKTVDGKRLRGVMVTQDGSVVKMVTQSIKEDWLAGKEPPPSQPVTEERARELAVKFFKDAGAKAPASEPSKIEPRADAALDPWESWWVHFKDATLKGRKGKLKAVVAVHKETGEAKWVDLTPKPKAPAKAPPTKKKKPAR